MKVTPLGKMDLRECQVRLTICLYPSVGQVGRVFGYSSSGQVVYACKACADRQFFTGEWELTGEVPEDQSIREFRQFVRDATLSPRNNLDAVLNNYSDKRWVLSVTLGRGRRVGDFWVVPVDLGSLATIRVAISMVGQPARRVLGDFGQFGSKAIEVKPVPDADTYDLMEGSLLEVTSILG